MGANGTRRSLALASQGSLVRLLALLPSTLLRKVGTASFLAQGVGWGAGTVREEVRAVTSFLPPSTSDWFAVDAGANRGDWTLEWLRLFPQSHVLCVEPASAAVSELRKRFARDNRVQVVQAALLDINGVAHLKSDVPASPRASLFGDSEETTCDEDVDTWMLDDLLKHLGLATPDVVKLDVEGAELHALRGSANTLASLRLLQFEYGEPSTYSGTKFRELWEFLSSAGFSIYRLGPRGLKAIDNYDVTMEVPMCTNYLAYRMERSP
jgi:FkbM family methyltransferase